MRRGVLLLNLGTPAKPSIPAIIRYLSVFLTDPRVINLPPIIRYPLVLGLIVPTRARLSTKAYQSIWDAERGSPLRFNTEDIVTALQNALGNDFMVDYAMRYGKPSINKTIQNMAKQCDHITLLPLFPQYASSSTGSALSEALNAFKKEINLPHITVCTDYFDHPAYIEALKDSVTIHASQKPVDHWLMSFHGLPESHIEKSCHKPCKQNKPCQKMGPDKRFCYRAQCYRTASGLAQSLNLKENEWTVSFQSRLGKTPWIKPYTDETLLKLREQGVRNLRILCPSFTVDCLETLEEIGIAGKEAWEKAGGNNYDLVPCLNKNPKWIECLTKIVVQSSPDWNQKTLTNPQRSTTHA
jgi:protoporphyrin/coproporphyrin ferrochelatase